MAFTPLVLLLAVNAAALPTPLGPEGPEAPTFTKEQSAALTKKGLDPKLLNPEAAGSIDALDPADYAAFRAWNTDPARILEADRTDPKALDVQLGRMREFVSPEKLAPLERLLDSNRRLASRGVSAPLPPAGDRPAPSAPAFTLTSPSGSLSPLSPLSPAGLLSSDFKGGLTSARFSPVPATTPSLSLAPPAATPWWENSYNYYICKYAPERCPR